MTDNLDLGTKEKVSHKAYTCEINYESSITYNAKVNSLPNDKFLDRSKLKASSDDKINVTENLKFDLGKAENIMGKGQNAGYQQFLLFRQCFQKLAFPEVFTVGIVW